jgi:hypothetical protein
MTTSSANLSILNAGTISSSGGIGINASSGNGSATIIDYGNVSASSVAIDATTTGSALPKIVVSNTRPNLPGNPVTTIAATGSNSEGIVATTTAGRASVTITSNVTINAGGTSISIQNQGTSTAPGSIAVSVAGSINSGTSWVGTTGEAAAIFAGYTSSGAGDVGIDVTSTAVITAKSGVGIEAVTHGTGNIFISDAANITATAAESTNSTTTQAQYGISAFNYGTGNITVVDASGSTLTTGSVGVLASNQATSIATPSAVSVVALGAIISGTSLTNGATAPAGIIASFDPGGSSTYSAAVLGNVLVNAAGSVDALAGEGILAADHADGNIAVNVGGNVSITALYSATAASGNSPYAIGAFNFGPGNVAVWTQAGDVIKSGSTGINAVNEATAVTSALVTVNAAGTIFAGNIATDSGNASSGLSAGFLGGATAAANQAVTGDVIVNSDANINIVPQGTSLSTIFTDPSLQTSNPAITALSGWGIHAYNEGNGDVTVNDGPGASVLGTQSGIEADAVSGGSGSIAIDIQSAASTNPTTITGTSLYGLLAYSTDFGTSLAPAKISVITGSNTTTNSASVGINAVNEAVPTSTNLVYSSIVVTNYATINSGATFTTGTNKPPAGITAGNLGGSTVPTTFPLTGLNGDVVVNNFGKITAAAGDGIRAYTFCTGNVTVNDNAGTITASQNWTSPTNGYGDGINASNEGPGNILVTTATGIGINSGSSGIEAVNRAPAPATSTVVVPSTSEVTVIAHGTITSGAIPYLNGDPAAGILAGYDPNAADTVNANVAGSVWIDDYATIVAAAGTDGIRGINYGTGTVTIITEADATITGGRYGVGAFAYGGGNVSITNYAVVTGTTAAIDALSSGLGTVSIDNYGTINGAIISGRAMTFHNESGATWTTTGGSSFAGTTELTNDGMIVLNGGALTVASLSNTGMLTLNTGSSLTVTRNVVTTAATQPGSVMHYEYYQVYGGTFTVNGTFAQDGASVTTAAGGRVQLAALSSSVNGGFDALAVADITSSIEIGTAGGAGGGSISVDTGVSTTVAGSFSANSILDNGTIVVPTAGSLSLAGALSGTGQIAISAGANLTVEGGTLTGASGAASSTATIAFQGAAATLTISSAALDASLNFGPTISGFNATDAFLFNGIATSASYSAGVLTLLNGATAVAHLNLTVLTSAIRSTRSPMDLASRRSVS